MRVSVVGRGFSTEIQFRKPVLSYGELGIATTWEDGKTGIYGNIGTGKSFILSGLSELIGKFIVQYLKVNQEYCKQS